MSGASYGGNTIGKFTVTNGYYRHDVMGDGQEEFIDNYYGFLAEINYPDVTIGRCDPLPALIGISLNRFVYIDTGEMSGSYGGLDIAFGDFVENDAWPSSIEVINHTKNKTSVVPLTHDGTYCTEAHDDIELQELFQPEGSECVWEIRIAERVN